MAGGGADEVLERVQDDDEPATACVDHAGTAQDVELGRRARERLTGGLRGR